MKLAWVTQTPPGVSFDPEVGLLQEVGRMARRIGLRTVPKSGQDSETRSYTDLVIESPHGRLLFAVRPKSSNDHARIDVDSRPTRHHRTRHVRLERNGDGAWRIVTDSDIPLEYRLDENGLRHLADQMLGE